MHTLVFSQEACGQAWVLYDVAILTAMLICAITYSVYIRSLADFQPHDTYPVYDSLGGAQARLLLPKKQEPSTYNGEASPLHKMSACILCNAAMCTTGAVHLCLALVLHVGGSLGCCTLLSCCPHSSSSFSVLRLGTR